MDFSLTSMRFLVASRRKKGVERSQGSPDTGKVAMIRQAKRQNGRVLIRLILILCHHRVSIHMLVLDLVSLHAGILFQ